MNLENLVNFSALARNTERGKPHERRTNNNNKQQTSVITTTMEWQTTKAQTNKKKEKETKRNKTAGKEKKARPVCQCSFLKCYYCKLTAQKVPVYKADEAIVIDSHSLIQERTHNFSCFEWRSNTTFLKKKN